PPSATAPQATTTRPPSQVQGEVYQWLKVFTEVLSYIESNYINPVDTKEVMSSATRAMLKAAGLTGSRLPSELYKKIQEMESILPGQGGVYESLKVFTEVLSYIKSNLGDRLNTKEVMSSAIQAALRAADPQGSFMPPEVYQEMQEGATSGQAG